MKTLHAALLGFVLLPAGGILYAEPQSYTRAVQVNGKPILDSEVREAVQAQEHLIRTQITDLSEAESRILVVRASALFALMERQLILSDFEQRRGSIPREYVEDDIDNLIRQKFGGDRAKFLRELAKSGMTLQGFREQREKAIAISHLSRQKIKDLPPPTPAQVENYYREHEQMFRDKDFVTFSTITIPMYPAGDGTATPAAQKKLAEDIRAQIVTGAAFDQMAKAHSTDPYARVGGQRGTQDRASLSPQIAEVAFKLKAGAVSHVVELNGAYMILFCESIQPGRREPLDKVRAQVEQLVSAEMSRKVLNQWVSGLARKAVIQPENMRESFLKWLGNERTFLN
jgi:parvulin-like peptidyl-prolyl isomerase